MLRLQELGFTNAYALLGGLGAWTSQKYPTGDAPPDAAPNPQPPMTAPTQQQPPAPAPTTPPKRQMEATQPH